MANVGLVFLWIVLGLLMIAMAYAIHNKKQYGLLNGVASYSEEEREEAEKNGYFIYMGRYVWVMAILFNITFPLLIFGVPYGAEIFITVVLASTLGGALYGIKKDIKRTRKRNAIILSIVTLLSAGGIGYLFFIGNQETTVRIEESMIVIEGMYDDKIKITDIEEMALTDQLPKNMIKSNGYATETRLIGSFRSKEHGPSRVHVFRKNPPYIGIQTSEKYYLINSKDADETREWYGKIEQLRSVR